MYFVSMHLNDTMPTLLLANIIHKQYNTLSINDLGGVLRNK